MGLADVDQLDGGGRGPQAGVSEETIDGLLDRWIERAVDWDAWEKLGVIGLDEIALKRGHRDVVVLVTVPLAGGGVEILAVLADRKKETVAAFLRAIPETLRRTIERACTDMYEGFVRAIEEEVPWAEIGIDRFHVAQAYRGCADTVRKKELKRRKRALPKAEYAEIKGAMWPFRKRPGALEPQEWELLERLFTYSPKIEAAYHLREDLTDLFEHDYTKTGAKCAIRAWCKRVRQSGLAEFVSVVGTIDRWIDEITNDFQGRQTSGFVEGFNNRVKVLKRRCYGIFNVGRLFQRLTLDCMATNSSVTPDLTTSRGLPREFRESRIFLRAPPIYRTRHESRPATTRLQGDYSFIIGHYSKKPAVSWGWFFAYSRCLDLPQSDRTVIESNFSARDLPVVVQTWLQLPGSVPFSVKRGHGIICVASPEGRHQ